MNLKDRLHQFPAGKYSALNLLLIILAIVLYGQSVNFGYNLDDNLILNKINVVSNDLSGLADILQSRYNITDYRPVTMVSFQLERMLTGELRPGISHIINLALYILTLVLLVRLVAEIVPQDHRNRFFLIAAAVILFCVHPIHANVVSSIRNRDGLLSMLFTVLAMLFLFRMIRRQYTVSGLILFALFFFLAIYSKRDATGVILLAPLTLLLYSYQKKKVIFWVALACLAVIISFPLISSFLAPISEETKVLDIIQYSENPMSMKSASRYAAFSTTVFLYVKMFLYPVDYLYYFGYDVYPFPFEGGSLVFAVLLTLGLIGFFGWAAWRSGKNMDYRLIAFGLMFMAINMVYCINFFVPVAGIAAARMVYISSFGFCLVAAVGMSQIKHIYLRGVLLALLVILLGGLSNDRSKDWRSYETLVEADIDKLVNSHDGNRIAGEIYTLMADTIPDPLLRERYYRKAKDRLVRSNQIYSGGWKAQYFEGYVHYRLGDVPNGIRALQKSMDLNPQFNVNIAEMLGDAYYYAGNYKYARKTYKQIWENDRESQYILSKISNAYLFDNNQKRLQYFNDSIMDQHPDLFAPYENIGYMHMHNSDTLMAVESFRQALDHGLTNPSIEAFVNAYPK